jgi:hypothetical protein
LLEQRRIIIVDTLQMIFCRLSICRESTEVAKSYNL